MKQGCSGPCFWQLQASTSPPATPYPRRNDARRQLLYDKQAAEVGCVSNLLFQVSLGGPPLQFPSSHL
eukprot:1160312-Pelagomonas_calceolata.AAC.4